MPVNTQEKTEWSFMLYKLLCNEFGTEKEICRKQFDYIVRDKMLVDSFGMNQISSGSRAEGLEFSDSDTDIMMCLNNYYVFQTEKDADLHRHIPVRLIMERENTESVFTKLRLYGKINDNYHLLFDGDFLSSKLSKEYMLRTTRQIAESKIHGPCVSDSNDTVDITYTLRCNKWIDQANSWTHRSRSAWPSINMIKTIIGYGVLFVPIGCKESKDEDLQWRISFSVAEKLLICSFTHTQHLCYAAMKVMLKDLIQQKQPDLLCSYFIKTIMLWLAEESDPSFWTPVNMMLCFKMCLKRLVYCVEYKLCSHYFIPEVNFFENRFPGQRHSQLLAVLYDLHELGWESLLQTRLGAFYMVRSREKLVSDQNRNIVHIFKFFEYLRRDRSKMLIFCYYIFNHLQYVTTHSLNTLDQLNKYFYTKYTKAMSVLSLATLINAPSAWSIIALVLSSCKNYTKSRIVVRHCFNTLSHVNYLTNDIQAFEITKPLFGYILQFTEPIVFKDRTLNFCCASDILPNEIKPPMNQFERSQILYSENILNNIYEDVDSCMNSFFCACVSQIVLRGNALNTDLINRCFENIHLSLTHLQIQQTKTTLRFHASTFLHFIDFLSSYHLKDHSGAQRALQNLETETNSLIARNFRKEIPIEWDILSLRIAKRLLKSMEGKNS